MSDVTQQENKTAPDLVVTMDQLPADTTLRGQSPLHHVDLASVASVVPVKNGVILQELKLLGHLVVRGDAKDAGFRAAIQKVLGLDLPDRLQCKSNDDIMMLWVSPDEWLVLLPGEKCFKAEADIRQAYDGHFALVNVSGGQTVLKLSGRHAQDVLKKSTGYDVGDQNFSNGKAVTTVFAKTQALITRVDQEEWLLVIRRSYADYIWLWLQKAAAEYGLKVVV